MIGQPLMQSGTLPTATLGQTCRAGAQAPYAGVVPAIPGQVAGVPFHRVWNSQYEV